MSADRTDFQAFLGAMGDLLFVFGTDGRILHVNPAVPRGLDLPKEELIGKEMAALCPAEDREQAEGILSDAQKGKASLWSHSLMTRGGACILVETRMTPGQWEGKPVLFAVSRDMTERRMVENMVAAQRDLGVALSAASTLDEALRLAAGAALQVSGMDCAAVYVVTDNGGNLRLATHKGLSEEFVEEMACFDTDSS